MMLSERYLGKMEIPVIKPAWIIIINEVPVGDPRPEKWGIYWALPYDEGKEAVERQRDKFYLEQGNDALKFFDHFGFEANLALSRSVIIDGREVVIRSDEYNLLTAENMDLYVNGPIEDQSLASHVFVPSNLSGDQVIDFVVDLDYRYVYESALLDGCSENQAKLMALGYDLSAVMFPAVGWYKIKDSYRELLG